ncbi:MAG TPA: flagellar biosynthesis protein FlhB [Syntrophorhabdaceae bacterium]|nr:flagellar biosynthesis protein FlhB [Syntrophorhabdaceae bacterium]
MADTFQEKTEQPTEKRLEDARKKGQVPQSRELTTCFLILFLTIFLYFSLSRGFEEMFRIYTGYVRNMSLDVNMDNIQDILHLGFFNGLKVVLPVFGLLIANTILGSFLQTGFVWSFEALKFNVETLDPIKGIKKLFSRRSGVEVLKAILKILILGYIAYSIITKELPELLSLHSKDVQFIVQYMGRIAFTLTLKVCIVLLFMAGLDFLFQWWQHRKDLMMTHQEIKEEFKEREGNPLVKSRIRSIQREMARKRMIEDVKTADVVVTNPTTYAVALTYKAGKMPAPQVVAKGAGFIAQKIKEVAREHMVTIVENKPLAQALFFSVKVGQFIPEKFYVVVAELLAYVYKQKNRTGLL